MITIQNYIARVIDTLNAQYGKGSISNVVIIGAGIEFEQTITSGRPVKKLAGHTVSYHHNMIWHHVRCFGHCKTFPWFGLAVKFSCFTEDDVMSGNRIMLGDYRNELVYAPLLWHEKMQTASGYGIKLVSRYKIWFEGKLYRLYTICFSNCGSTYFTINGRQIFVS
jgi:hypothetical protein